MGKTERPRRGLWLWAVLLPAFVLALSAGIQGRHLSHKITKPANESLAELVPTALAGWSGQDVPLGATEYLAGEAKKTLDYDDMVNREYVRGTVTFGVYVAYWTPGKVPYQVVAVHTPDCCWISNGWECLDMRFQQREAFSGGALKPAEWRLFKPPDGGPPTYVLFWQLVDGRLFDYGRRFNAITSPSMQWKVKEQQLLHGNGEQYFIRLTSSVPFEDLSSDPGFDEVLASLAKLGLAAKED